MKCGKPLEAGAKPSAHLVGSRVPRDRGRAGRASLPSFATASFCLVAFTVATLAVFALPPVCPALPPVTHDDTETVTNVPFAAWQDYAGKFKFSLTCQTTPTNNVQVAFGTDADDDGVLSLAESDLIVGWDCGTWFVQNGFEGERVESAVGSGSLQTMAFTAKINSRTSAPVSVEATIDGVATFAGLDASILYRRSWNMMRLTGRGLDAASESAEVRVLPDSLSIFLR